MSGIPAKVRRVVLERADGRCEGCGETRPLELHHRKFRSRGGKHTVPNVLALCGWGNQTGCHGDAHSAAPPAGWAVHSWEDETALPFRSRDDRWWFLTADGRRQLCADPLF